jgi:hypothetical protein
MNRKAAATTFLTAFLVTGALLLGAGLVAMLRAM